MAKLKNRTNDKKRKEDWKRDPTSIPIPTGQKYQLTWYYWLTAHSFIHGGLIWFFFQDYTIMIIETIAHFSIDYLKCANKTNIHIDQGLHISFRILYGIIIVLR